MWPTVGLIVGAVAAGAMVSRFPSLSIGVSLGLVALSLVLGRSTSASSPSLAVVGGWALSAFVAEAGVGANLGLTGFNPVKLLPLVLMGVGTVVTAVRHPARRPFPSAGRWVVLYVAWLTICALTSELPALSLLRVAQAALPVFVAVVLYTRGAGRLSLLLATGMACTAHVVWAVMNPVYVGKAGTQRLTGLLVANAFALVCGLVVVTVVGLWQGRLIPRRLLLPAAGAAATAAYGITASIGRTASIGVPLAICVSIFASRAREREEHDSRINRRRQLLTIAVGLCAVAALSSSGGIVRWFETGNHDLGGLTGRTTLWKEITQSVADRPLFGYGPGAMRFGVEGISESLRGAVALAQSHNSFFEALLSGGLIGAALWLGMMAALVRHVISLPNHYRPVAAGVLALLSVSSITLGNMAGFGIGWFALMSLLCVDSPPSPGSEPLAPGGDTDAKN